MSLRFQGDRLFAVLADGRTVIVPIDFYPTLRAASPKARRSFTIFMDGEGVEWPGLDLQLPTWAFTEGRREHIPPPGFREWLAAARAAEPDRVPTPRSRPRRKKAG